MRYRISWSTRALGAMLGVFGLSLAAAIPLGTTWSEGHNPNLSEAATKSSVVSKTAVKNTTAAARYRWGKAVAGDEFNYTGAPNRTKWKVYYSRGHNNQGYRRPSAWKVSGGVATVSGNAKGVTGGMSSRYNQKYGRWEARMKVSRRDHKYHPNILLWPGVRTKGCPEVDFAESTNDTTRIKFFLHYDCKPRQTRAAKVLDMTRWHNYAVEWTPTHIYGYIDGRLFFKDTNRAHFPKVPMHACIQLDWFRKPGQATKPTTMSVAWIRIYKAPRR
jgi:beta-glucanase (GH16 family)